MAPDIGAGAREAGAGTGACEGTGAEALVWAPTASTPAPAPAAAPELEGTGAGTGVRVAGSGAGTGAWVERRILRWLIKLFQAMLSSANYCIEIPGGRQQTLLYCHTPQFPAWPLPRRFVEECTQDTTI